MKLKYKFLSLISISILIFSLIGCNKKSDKYTANESPPHNVRESFYIKSVEVLNFYIEKIESKTIYTNEDNEYLLEYYRSTPSSNSEEVMIKTSLTYLDLINKDLEYLLKEPKDDELKLVNADIQNQIKEVLKLLEINE